MLSRTGGYVTAWALRHGLMAKGPTTSYTQDDGHGAGDDRPDRSSLAVERDGFNLHAGVRIEAGDDMGSRTALPLWCASAGVARMTAAPSRQPPPQVVGSVVQSSGIRRGTTVARLAAAGSRGGNRELGRCLPAWPATRGAVREEHRIAERQRIARQVHAIARDCEGDVLWRAAKGQQHRELARHRPAFATGASQSPSTMTQRVTDVNVNDVPEVQLAGSGLVSGGISGICKAHVDIAPSAFTSRL